MSDLEEKPSHVPSRFVAEAMRDGRNMALDAAIEICAMMAEDGHNAACCVAALKDFRNMTNELAPVPSKTN